MKITEKKLLENLDGISVLGDFMSTINSVTYYWNYGYRDNCWWHPGFGRDDAEEIKITKRFDEFIGIIPIPQRCMCKVGLKKAENLLDKWEEDVRKS